MILTIKGNNSDWLAKTRSLYGSLKAREREYLKVKVELPFTLGELREWLAGLRSKAAMPASNSVGRSLWFCYLCSRPMAMASLSIDHVTPLAHSGRTSLDNLKPCCTSCNRAKGAMSLSGYRALRETVNSLHPKEQRYFWTRWSAGSRARWTEAKRADNRKAREILARVLKSKQR